MTTQMILKKLDKARTKIQGCTEELESGILFSEDVSNTLTGCSADLTELIDKIEMSQVIAGLES